jgi:hypothetical protein
VSAAPLPLTPPLVLDTNIVLDVFVFNDAAAQPVQRSLIRRQHLGAVQHDAAAGVGAGGLMSKSSISNCSVALGPILGGDPAAP